MSLYELQPSLTVTEVYWITGAISGAMPYGALVTLCIITIGHLRSPNDTSVREGFLNQRRIFRGHVLLILLLNTIMQVDNIRGCLVATFYTNPADLTHPEQSLFYIVVGLTISLTDGLLVSGLCLKIPCAVESQRSPIDMAMLRGPESPPA